jgi:hypothetical protein
MTSSHPTPSKRLREAKRNAHSVVMPIEGVEGLGIGDGTIRVYVRDGSVARILPGAIDGVPIEAVVVGEVTAQ